VDLARAIFGKVSRGAVVRLGSGDRSDIVQSPFHLLLPHSVVRHSWAHDLSDSSLQPAVLSLLGTSIVLPLHVVVVPDHDFPPTHAGLPIFAGFPAYYRLLDLEPLVMALVMVHLRPKLEIQALLYLSRVALQGL
jgi:hypothetical protein